MLAGTRLFNYVTTDSEGPVAQIVTFEAGREGAIKDCGRFRHTPQETEKLTKAIPSLRLNLNRAYKES